MPTLSLPRIRTALVDSSAFHALLDRDDANHGAATAILEGMLATRARPFTTNFVVAECHALLLGHLGANVARRFLRSFERGSVTVVQVTPVDEERARAIIYQYLDKDFSMTDATSFAVMERLAVAHAFAFDRHFNQYGWTILTPALLHGRTTG